MSSPSAVVEVEAGPAKGLSLTVTPAKTVPVGRDKSLEGCLRDQTISRTHGRLQKRHNFQFYSDFVERRNFILLSRLEVSMLLMLAALFLRDTSSATCAA